MPDAISLFVFTTLYIGRILNVKVPYYYVRKLIRCIFVIIVMYLLVGK